MHDLYLDENGVLKNKLGISDQQELSSLEFDIAAAEEAALLESPPQAPFDFDLLLKLHERLLGEVYSWAGKPRIIPLAKRSYEGADEGTTSFTPPFRITAEAEALFRAMPSMEAVRSLSAPEFADAIAPLFVKLNNIHPFREGNGRTQRLFFKLFARACGHELAWDVVTKERMIAASISGARGQGEPMKRLFHEITNPRRVAALRKALASLRKSSDLNCNDVYVATTTAGQIYSGKLAGVAGTDFMMRVENADQPWIAVGDSRDVPDGTGSGEPLEIKPKHW